MGKSILTLSYLFAMFVLSGCSIAMALSGEKEPNFDYITVGAPRNQVEAELGHPIAASTLDGSQQEAVYKYEMGNSPNPARAVMWGYAWLTIIGILGEPIYSLIELHQGHDEETRIVYGQDDRILEIHGYTPPVSKVLIEADEAQEKYIDRRRRPVATESVPAPVSQ